MKIVSAKVKFSRQKDEGVLMKKVPGFYSERGASAPLVEGESLETCVQRAFGGVKARVCEDINIPPGHELKPSK